MSIFRSRPKVDPQNPRARAKCDNCVRIVFRDQLKDQMIWVGDRLAPSGFLRCPHCMDIPQPQDRARKLRPDPVPVRRPRLDDVVVTAITIWDVGLSIWDVGHTFWDT